MMQYEYEYEYDATNDCHIINSEVIFRFESTFESMKQSETASKHKSTIPENQKRKSYKERNNSRAKILRNTF
jgi:hypothetical protein